MSKAYEDMMPHQQRVVAEREALHGNLTRLRAFIGEGVTPHAMFAALPEDEQSRLTRQCSAMAAYLAILDERIEAFD